MFNLYPTDAFLFGGVHVYYSRNKRQDSNRSTGAIVVPIAQTTQPLLKLSHAKIRNSKEPLFPLSTPAPSGWQTPVFPSVPVPSRQPGPPRGARPLRPRR